MKAFCVLPVIEILVEVSLGANLKDMAYNYYGRSFGSMYDVVQVLW